MAQPALRNDELPRLRPTALDGLVAALTPALIIGMISCLVFFLVLVVYQGEFTQRLMYILGLFTFAIVLVARIAIEQSRAVAFGYTLILGGATFFVTMRFVSFPEGLAPLSPVIVAGFLVLIGFLADRITFDCTLIDEAEDSSGVGLLQSLGVLRNPQGESSQRKLQNEPHPSSRVSEARKKAKRHNPGVWVLYFALMAIPLFGLGQLLIPAADEQSRRSAFLCLFGYLFFSLSLLVVTSFLSMRRYLRKRTVAMPPKLSFIWIGSGILGMLGLLSLIALIPLPNGSLGLADLPFRISSPEGLTPSDHGWGDEGIPQDQTANKKGVDAKKSKERAQGDGQSKNTEAANEGQAKSKEGAKSNSEQNESHKDSSATREASQNSDKAKSSEDQNEGLANTSKASKKAEPQASDAKKKPNQDPEGTPSNHDAKNSPPKDQDNAAKAKNNQRQQGIDSDKNPTPPPEVPPQRPGSQWSMSLAGGFANLFRWLVSLVLIGLIGYWLIRYRREFGAAWRDLMAWWQGLFKTDEQVTVATSEAEKTVMVEPLRSFREFSNPFDNKDASMTAALVIQQTFEALEAWGREHGLIRNDRETPQEYLLRLMARFPDQSDQFQNLAQIYNRLAYAGGRTTSQEVRPLRELWVWLTRTAVVRLIVAVTFLHNLAIAEESDLDFRQYWIRSVDSNGARNKKPIVSSTELDRDRMRVALQARLTKVELARAWSSAEAASLYRDLMRWHWLGDGSIQEAKILPSTATAPLKFDLQSRVPRPKVDLGWPAGYNQVSSPHFRITTQASTQLAVEVAKLCEQTYSIWQQLFFDMWSDSMSLQTAIRSGQRLALPQTGHRFEVVLFRDRDTYLKQLTRVEPNVAVSTGYYSPKMRTVFCYWDAATSEPTLRHELSHQFFQEGTRWETVDPSLLTGDFWIIEGLALYMESIRIEHGASCDQAIVGGWDAARLQPARYRRLHDQTWIEWNEFRSASNDRFRDGDAIKMWYSQGAGLAHLWMDSNAEKRESMILYAQSVLQGRPDPTALNLWNEDNALRTAYDRFLLQPNDESQWKPLSNVRDVVLSRCSVDSATLLAWPESYRQLEWLDLSFTQIDDSLFMDATKNNAQAHWDVRRLNIESTRVTNRALPIIAKMPRLEELDLSNGEITDLGLKALQGNRTIKTLWLNGNSKITDDSIDVLASMTRLEQIDVQGTAISEAAWEALLKKSPKLRRKRG
jgi:Domain of unknown function (DUF4129)